MYNFLMLYTLTINDTNSGEPFICLYFYIRYVIKFNCTHPVQKKVNKKRKNTATSILIGNIITIQGTGNYIYIRVSGII